MTPGIRPYVLCQQALLASPWRQPELGLVDRREKLNNVVVALASVVVAAVGTRLSMRGAANDRQCSQYMSGPPEPSKPGAPVQNPCRINPAGLMYGG